MSDTATLVDGPYDGLSVVVPYVQDRVWMPTGESVSEYRITNLFPLEYTYVEGGDGP